MRAHRIIAAFIAIGALARSTGAAEPLSLGQGTACVLMSEREAKAKLGVKKRHVLACASPDSQVVRVVMTRKGLVDCTDVVRVAANGTTTNAAPCRAVPSAHEATVPPVVNLSGSWTSDVDSLVGMVTCATQVQQDGSKITISATCDILGLPGEFNGSGSISFEGYSFSARGPAYVPQYGPCNEGGIDATVTPDGQSISGTLSCDGLVVTFTSRRAY